MPEWTREQLVIALEFYYTCPENMHTDSHVMCQEIAELVEHTPGALDRVIRNIKFVDQGNVGLAHASQMVHDLVGEYRDRQGQLRADAQTIRDRNGWGPLQCHD